ncbi:unnamed protein product [Orchesella dallaii]|uniref:Uncharacterized protein n=1 Tax=Orchesella dallaii TaxID=48710 RepID=A0ABP1QG56_9HEXA
MVINRMSKMTISKKQGQKRPPVSETETRASNQAALERRSSHTNKSKSDIRRQSSAQTNVGGGGGGDSGKRCASKKMYFIVAFCVYMFVTALFFIIHLALFIYIWGNKMSNFINPGSGFFTVVPDAFWLMWRFLIGNFVHFIVGGFLILILIGIKKTEQVVMKHQDKLLAWVMVVAFIAEYLMSSAVMWHFIAYPLVINGGYGDAITPPFPTTSSVVDINCYNSHVRPLRLNLSRLDPPATQHVHVNLRWLIDVTCYKELWRTYVPAVSSVSKDCVSYVSAMERSSIRDCSHATILHIALISQLFLDILGLFFCAAVMYLYAKAVVRSEPGRFSFDVSTYDKDMEQLGEVVRKYAGASQHKIQEVKFAKDGDAGASSSSSPPVPEQKVLRSGGGSASSAGPEPAKVFHHP